MNFASHKKACKQGLFGVAPVYFKLLQDAPALVIIAHRIIRGVLFLLMSLIIREKKSLFTSLGISYKQMAMLLLLTPRNNTVNSVVLC